ncbi:MAG: hypothetical protein SNG27_10980 [Rikenellaceae bacterium]
MKKISINNIATFRQANILKTLPLLALLSVVGCSEDSTSGDDGDDGSGGGSVVVETFGYSADPEDVTTARFANDSYVTFTHTSENAVSLELILDEGAQFLVDNFDSEGDLATQIDSEKGSASSATQESVYFTQAGYTTVTLKAEFTEKLTDLPTGVSQKQSEDNDGYWKAVVECEIPLFDKELSAVVAVSADVYADGEDDSIREFSSDVLGNSSATIEEITVYEGATISFEDLTTEQGFTSTADLSKLSSLGSKLGRTWSYDGEDATMKQTVAAISTITFADEGEYEGFYITVNRTKPEAVAVESEPLYIPLKVVVVEEPLTPVTASDFAVTNVDGGALKEITLTTSSSFGVAGTVLSATLEGFTLSVTNNSTAVDGITVTEARIDDTDNTKLILTLSGNIYSDDVVKLSFATGDNDATAFDVGQKTLVAFDETTVTNTIGTILNQTYYNFTGLATGTTFNGSAISTYSWYSETVAADFTCVDDPTGVENNDGAVVKLSVSNATKNYAIYTRSTAALSIPAGTYKISVRFYLPSAISSGSYQITYNPTALNTWTAITSGNYADIDTGEWVTISENVTYNDTDYADARLRILFASSTVGLLAVGDTIYFDDIELVPVRPTE